MMQITQIKQKREISQIKQKKIIKFVNEMWWLGGGGGMNLSKKN